MRAASVCAVAICASKKCVTVSERQTRASTIRRERNLGRSLVGRSNGPGSMSSPPTTFFFCPHTQLPLPIPFSPRLLNKLNVSPQDTQTSVRVMCVGPRMIYLCINKIKYTTNTSIGKPGYRLYTYSHQQMMWVNSALQVC